MGRVTDRASGPLANPRSGFPSEDPRLADTGGNADWARISLATWSPADVKTGKVLGATCIPAYVGCGERAGLRCGGVDERHG